MGKKKLQKGFTLVELMIGLVVGLVVIGGSLAFFANTLNSSISTLKMVKLNQDMNAVMQYMVNEVRRSGFSTDSTATLSFDAATDCFLYSYNDDLDDSTVVKTVGIKLVGGVLYLNDTVASCAAMSGGTALTDSGAMNISSFDVDMSNSKCVSVVDSTELDYVSGSCDTSGLSAGDQYVTIREIQITFSAASATDADIDSTLIESVRVRNDIVTTI